MANFVALDSVVRKIWGKGDTILFIFAGASAEFALNKAVDWLYFTGKLPADPIGRLFSTVCYAQRIVFASEQDANQSIDRITAIHVSVEAARQAKIPDWAYRDVLYMLIHYSISAFEVLERKLSDKEKEEVFDVFYRVGTRMKLKDLPATHKEWLKDYAMHLKKDLSNSHFTKDLFAQYRKHLGPLRYALLLHTQNLVVPQPVKELLSFGRFSAVSVLLPFYKLTRGLRLDQQLRSIILPAAYRKQINDLDAESQQ